MASPKNDNILLERHYVTLVLRLSLDQEGELSQSELVDTTGSLSRRFTNRLGLHQVLDDCLNQLSQSYTKKHQPELQAPPTGNSQSHLD